MIYRVKIEFDDGDVQWYVIAARTRDEAYDIVFDNVLDAENIYIDAISDRSIYCVPQEMYDDLEYREFRG